MSDEEISNFMAGLGYDAKQGAPLQAFQSGMRQIMRFTMSDKSVTAALASICKDRQVYELIYSLHCIKPFLCSPFGAFIEAEVEKALSPDEFAFLKKNPAVFAPQEVVVHKTGAPDENVTVSALQMQTFIEHLASV
jgi:hypothetical protein